MCREGDLGKVLNEGRRKFATGAGSVWGGRMYYFPSTVMKSFLPRGKSKKFLFFHLSFKCPEGMLKEPLLKQVPALAILLYVAQGVVLLPPIG